MSRLLERTVTCRACGEKISCLFWRSINTGRKSAAEDVISGRLFEAVCPSCGRTTTLDYPILFNDMEHHVWIHYAFPDRLEETVRLIQAFPKFQRNRQRFVTSQKAFREKVLIFTGGMDDRIIEIAKIFSLDNMREKYPDARMEPLYLLGAGEGLTFLSPLCGTERYLYLDIPYRELEQRYSAYLPPETCDGSVIDTNWARKLVKKD